MVPEEGVEPHAREGAEFLGNGKNAKPRRNQKNPSQAQAHHCHAGIPEKLVALVQKAVA